MSKDRSAFSGHGSSVTIIDAEKKSRVTFGDEANDIPFELSNKTGGTLEKVPAFLEQLKLQC